MPSKLTIEPLLLDSRLPPVSILWTSAGVYYRGNVKQLVLGTSPYGLVRSVASPTAPANMVATRWNPAVWGATLLNLVEACRRGALLVGVEVHDSTAGVVRAAAQPRGASVPATPSGRRRYVAQRASVAESV